MKIKKIEIHDFRSLSNVVIDNLDPHLNLLMGVNGAGKSSVLDAIVYLLSSFTARLTTSGSKGSALKETDVKIGSKKGCNISIMVDDKGCKADDNDGAENIVSWSKYKDLKLDKKDESDYAQLNILTKDYRTRLDEEEVFDIPVIVHYGVRRSVTNIPERLAKNSKSSPTTCYVDWQNSDASFRSFFEWFRKEQNYENSLRVEDSTARVRGLVAIRQAMRLIFPEYTGLKVKHHPQVIVLKKNELELPLDSLSDGEKCYLSLVCDIVRRLAIANPIGEILKGEGIVLIDEVDLHLHPSWEATVMPKLHEVFPNIQFIVTAHSPLVASHFDGQVYGVRNGEVTALPRLFGLDYSTILQDWMGTRPENREVNSLIELYRAYTKHNMIEQAQEVKNRMIELFHGNVDAIALKKLELQAD